MISKYLRIFTSVLTAVALTATVPTSGWAQSNSAAKLPETKTPIKHVVVLFQENISFDHYFGTYPYAANPEGEPQFHPDPLTPRANNLLSGGLLTENPNTTQPFRLDRSCPLTSDQDHSYTPEQKAFDHGLMDAFVQNTGSAGTSCLDVTNGPGIVMGYYDGNTVTALWNWAQRYAISDNFYGTMFGPSTVGVLNLVAGSTTNVVITGETSAPGTIAGGTASGTLIGDIDAGYDDCSTKSTHGTTTDPNIGILLNANKLTWGWFQGGFAPTSLYNGTTVTKSVCASESSNSATGLSDVTDYVSHHNGFAYNALTANPHHLPPTGTVGTTDQANHEYDLSLFLSSITNGTLPSVSFVKAKALQNGHPGNSTPLDEQTWLVTAVNAIQNSKYWDDTAIFITYDDSDGWYDHQMDTVVNQSSSANDDDLSAPGACGATPEGGAPGRCGYGPRLPLLLISKYARSNYIDHRMTDQSSIIRFIEDNWGLGRLGGDSTDAKAGSVLGMFDFEHPAAAVKLDPSTGEPVDQGFGFGDGGFGGFGFGDF
jgi:phospholipase C